MNDFFCKKLKLEGFRGFRDPVEIAFHPRLNIFFGINGAGKSTILRAFIFFLSDILLNTLLDTHDAEGKILERTFPFKRSDINNQSAQLELHLTLNCKTDYKSEITCDNLLNQTYTTPFSKKIRLKESPLIASYSVDRFLPEGFTKELISSIYHPDPYDDLFNPVLNFSNLIQWLNLVEATVLQKEVENTNISQIAKGYNIAKTIKQDKELEIFRRTIESFTGLSHVGLDRNSDPITLKALKGNNFINSVQMSDGEKGLLALVGDMARRLMQLNPDMQNPLEGTGIVLIDEIDLHLHPQWQRTLIPGLVKTFPNIQFILTTHSPQILSQVEYGKIYQLKQDEASIDVEELRFIYGYDSNRILEEIMATDDRPNEIKEKFSEIYKMIDKNEFNSARKHIQDLQRKIGADSELDRMNMILEHKEVPGK